MEITRQLTGVGPLLLSWSKDQTQAVGPAGTSSAFTSSAHQEISWSPVLFPRPPPSDRISHWPGTCRAS